MSDKKWYFYCRDCSEKTWASVDYEESAILMSIIELYPLLRDSNKKIHPLLNISITSHSYTISELEEYLNFLNKHHDHDVIIRCSDDEEITDIK